MLNRLSKLFMATGVAATVTAGTMMPRPASADTTSTLLTAAAAIGAIVLYSNIQRKQQQANTVVGYTRNGGTVYADGRIVMPNGQTYYPNANGQSNINQYGYNNGYNPQTYGYNAYPNGAYNNGAYNNGAYNNGAYNNGAYNNGAYNNGAYNNGRRYDNARWQQQQAAAAQQRQAWQNRQNTRDNDDRNRNRNH
ncbi:MAG TPA: hypothetical protein VGD01_05195 [Candidatus Elarobacter sp.]|jgi:hypothetical protein